MDTTSLLKFFIWINEDILALPCVIIFFGSAIILTLKTGFIQIRGLPQVFRLLTNGVPQATQQKITHSDAINPFHALFAALATSIGMGNIVGPSVAIVAGGPGALFWMLFYMFFASVTKFTEVTFAMHTRIAQNDGKIDGGPIEYLRKANVFLSYWYGIIMSMLFIGWSGVQSNNLASIYALEQIPHWIIGLALALFTGYTLSGGAQRVGALASKLVPIMFTLYVSFALYILFSNPSALYNALVLIKSNIFTAAAPISGFMGATLLQAMRFGVFKGIFISEAGVGSSSIPHAMSDAKNPTDQGLLAMGSTVADMTLSILSGLLVLVTGIWMRGTMSNTLVYEVFKIHAPAVGQVALLISVTLFVVTTVIGNSFNGIRSFATLSKHRWVKAYMLLTSFIIFIGALLPMPLVWEIMETLLAFAAIPNLCGLLYLAFKYPHVLKISK